MRREWLARFLRGLTVGAFVGAALVGLRLGRTASGRTGDRHPD